MLDLETMGNGPNAAIVAIGAVEFEPEIFLLGREFYRVVDLASSVELGGEIDASAVQWWLGRSDEARAAIRQSPQIHIKPALVQFAEWLSHCSADIQLWGNGAAFDNVILAQAYKRAGLEVPWKFWNDRCYRTLAALHPDTPPGHGEGTAHHALDDARTQAKHLLRLFNLDFLARQLIR